MNRAKDKHRNLPTEDEVEAEANASSTSFGRLFKVARCERMRLYYTAFMLFLVSYVYSVCQNTKDALVSERLDPSSIPYLKILIVLPANLLVVFTVQKMLTSMSASKVFSKLTIIFGSRLVLMTFSEYIEMDRFYTRDWFIDGKMKFRGLECTSALTLTVNSWTSSLIYVVSELWGTVVFQYLYFSYLNEIYTQKQSLRFIPLLLVFANFALVVSAFSVKTMVSLQRESTFETISIIRRGIFVVMGSCVFIVYGLHRYFECNILSQPLFVSESTHAKKRKKAKVGFSEGLKIIATSKLVIAMSLVVLAYSISVNMVELAFKSCMKQYGQISGINVGSHVMDSSSYVQLFVGSLAMIILISPFPSLIRKKGFTYVAIAPPVICIIGMIAVFGTATYNVSLKNETPLFRGFFGKDMLINLWWEEKIGIAVSSAFKIMKYSALDVSKEALSMKVSPIYRARLKGVYDGLCGKFGKAIGSGLTNLQNGFFNTTDVREAAVSSFFIVGGLSIVWIVAVRYLGGKYDKSVHSNTDIDIDVFTEKTFE